MYGAASAPTGYLLCDGTAVSRSTYSALFAIVGTTFGIGDGSTTFNLPNMQNRYPRQQTSQLGATGGADTHFHQIDGGSQAAAAQVSITGSLSDEATVTTASWTGNANAGGFGTGTSTSHTVGAKVVGQTQLTSNDPPYLNVNFIIKT
jgi:microcystin-dependent protein